MSRQGVDVLVVGGGITGTQAAVDLADLGFKVTLVEKSSVLGGISTKLYRTYPFCFCCRLPVLLELAKFHPNVDVLLETQVGNIQGDSGDFEVNLISKRGQSILRVKAIVLAMGLEPNLDPAILAPYRWEECSNVITALELEELLKNNKLSPNIKKIAWIQCVGSREVKRGNYGYCSSVCCLYALKQAVNIKSRFPEIDTAIFYIDLRAYGRFYETYLKQAQALGIRCIQSRIPFVMPQPHKGQIALSYVERTGRHVEENFDLIVLSVGLKPSAESLTIAKKLGLQLNPWNFIKTSPLSPVKTSKDGVYVCGTLQEPKDIYQSLTQASATAQQIAKELGCPQPQAYPQARLDGQTVIVLSPKTEIAALKEEIQRRFDCPLLVLDNKHKIIQFLKDNSAARVIFIGFSHRLHEQALKRLARMAGISPFACELVNLENQCFRVHNKSDAASKALWAVATALNEVNSFELKPLIKSSVIPSALVIGSGISGLFIAQELANQGIKVDLVESQDRLGASLYLETIANTKTTKYLKAFAERLLSQVKNNPLIKVHLNANVISSSGSCGQFKTIIEEDGHQTEIAHAVTFITGFGQEAKVKGYPKDPRIITINQLIDKGTDILKNVDNVAIVQCVGSRNNDYSFCSRVCCTRAMIYALKIKEFNPQINVYVFYRDIRTYGFAEALYRQAREAGVVFVPIKDKVMVERSGLGTTSRLNVMVEEALLNKNIVFPTDLVILNTGIWPSENNQKLSKIFKIPLAEDGFFKTSTDKLKPVETNKPGVFVCGLATGPKLISEHLVSAQAAIAKAMPILKSAVTETWRPIAEVNKDNCDGCGYCVDVCPFGAIKLIEYRQGEEIKKLAEVDAGTCQGCGVCQATCPKEGIEVTGFSNKQLRALIDMALSPEEEVNW